MNEVIEESVFDDSLSFFWDAKHDWNMHIEISTKSYKNLLHGIYQIHKMHESIYQYRENVKRYLEMALINSIEHGTHVIDKEAIIDGMFDVETKSREEIEAKQRFLCRKMNY